MQVKQGGQGLVVIVWPFMGRDDELRRMHRLVTEGVHQGVVLAGPSGVGKTRLALECLRLAERAGLSTVRATATRSASSLPFGALAGLLPAGGRRPGAVDDRADLLRQAAAALVEQAGNRRLVVFVDDAHLLDDASATLVHQVATSGSAFVLVATRAGEPAPDPVVALWHDDLADRIELGSLPTETLTELLVAALGGPVDADTAAELTRRADGNVLFLRELVLGALGDGTLVDEDGAWRLRSALSPSARLIDLVETRLEGVDLAERALLELVAYGEPLGEAELQAVARPAAAESLERRGLLASTTRGRRLEVRLAHPIYSDVLRARIPVVRERAIARALAEAVEATGARRREDTLQVASWRLVGGGGRPEVLLAGATAARWRYDFELAERLVRAALDAGGGFDAELLDAQLASLQGRTAEAEAALLALAGRAPDDARRGDVALSRIHNSVSWTGYDAERVIDEAEAALDDPAWRDRLAAERLVLVHLTQGPRATAEAAAPLLARARGEALAVACIPAAYGLGRLGRLDAALDASARGHAAHLATPKPLGWYPWWHDVARCYAFQHAGRFAEADALATERYRRAVADGSSEAQAIFALMPAFAVAEQGGVRTAARAAREALALSRALDRPVLVRLCHVHAALALALDRRAAESEEALAELDALSLPPVRCDVDALRARGWAAVAAGDLGRACEHLEQAAELGDEVGDLVGQASALHALARLGRAAEARDRLAALAHHIDGSLAGARAAHADVLARQDPEGLEAISRDFEAMGAALLAAEAAADAAVARWQAGQRRDAAVDERRARDLAEGCESPATPALQSVAARTRLTAAERETAMLAAAGRGNRQIADRLGLSVRTVANRLQEVYGKLGISRRGDLARALEADPTHDRR